MNYDNNDPKSLENLKNESIDGSDVKGGNSGTFGGFDPAVAENVILGDSNALGADSTTISTGMPTGFSNNNLPDSAPLDDKAITGDFNPGAFTGGNGTLS